MDSAEIFLVKAEESLVGAESEFTNKRYNNCTNRAYYACLQAARAALAKVGIKLKDPKSFWGHGFIQSEFVERLVNRRKVYSSSCRETLSKNLILRQKADYEDDHITRTEAQRALSRAREFVAEVINKKD